MKEVLKDILERCDEEKGKKLLERIMEAASKEKKEREEQREGDDRVEKMVDILNEDMRLGRQKDILGKVLFCFVGTIYDGKKANPYTQLSEIMHATLKTLDAYIESKEGSK
jgi:hypothetical protein